MLLRSVDSQGVFKYLGGYGGVKICFRNLSPDVNRQYLADAGHPGHRQLGVTVQLQRSLAEEEVDLIVVSVIAAAAFLHQGRAHEVRLCRGRNQRLCYGSFGCIRLLRMSREYLFTGFWVILDPKTFNLFSRFNENILINVVFLF